ncbi:MAG TPA: hypothetical protein VE891_08245 [Allosphingosinicella sp.]|nr:hypothetical protein [Allosphingosinicella sp.]
MAITAPLLARRTHKWLALFVGLQALIWTLTGLYMTVVHIDIIHGDHFIRHAAARPIDPGKLVDPLAAARTVPGADGVRLHWLLDRPTYIVSTKGGASLVDAINGNRVPPPSEADVRRLADHWFTGKERLVKVSLIDKIPSEIRSRKPPLWRADFDGWNKPTLYFSPRTGELVSRRHELWRVFDFVWMLHIMDYWTRDNVNNPLLRVVTWAAVLMALSGAWLLVYSFPRRRRTKAAP